MRISFLYLLFTVLSINIKAQTVIPFGEQAPKIECDIYPVFPKNDGDFNLYLAHHIKKLDVSVENDIKVTISIQINVDSTGKTTIQNINKNLLPAIAEELNKIALAAPLWKPATLNGKPVNYSYQGTFYVEVNAGSSSIYVEAFPRARLPKVYMGPLFTAVEVNPSFPGGQVEFYNFINRTTRYPQAAKDRRISGKVFVQFIVEADGSLTNLTVIRDPGYGLGQEAIRLLCIGPKWIPGKQNGKPVRVQFIVPFLFHLPK